MMTMIWPIAWMTVRIFSRLPSVAPTHLERKFFSLMVVRPHSLANASATKVLPVPIGPVKRMPIGTRLRSPVADVLGDREQVLLDLLHAADHLEAVLRLDELDEAEALALDDLALALGDEPVDLAPRAIRAARVDRCGGRARRGRAASHLVAAEAGVSAASLCARSAARRAPEDAGDERLTRGAILFRWPAAARGWRRSGSPSGRR